MRSASESLTSLNNQLRLALLGHFRQAELEQTYTGIKDRRLTHFMQKLRECSDQGEALGLGTSEISTRLQALRQEWPDDLFNPAFAFTGMF
jgi:hypothetical protein